MIGCYTGVFACQIFSQKYSSTGPEANMKTVVSYLWGLSSSTLNLNNTTSPYIVHTSYHKGIMAPKFSRRRE